MKFLDETCRLGSSDEREIEVEEREIWSRLIGPYSTLEVKPGAETKSCLTKRKLDLGPTFLFVKLTVTWHQVCIVQ